MNDEQFDLIGHSLGVNIYHAKISEKEKHKYLPDEFYRNYYCAGKIGGVYPEFKELLEKGYVETWTKFGNDYFSVTERGILEFRNEFTERITNSYVQPKKSRQKYLEYISSGYDSFEDFLGIQMPKREYINGGYRFSSTKYRSVSGEVKPTIKEAKESYKKALKKHKLGC